jgi:hypothetical protein
MIINDVKNLPDPCPPDSLCGVSPGLANGTLVAFDGHLLASSKAIDAGTPQGAPTADLDGRPRDATPDVGAYEYDPWEPTAWRYLPALTRARTSESH